MNEQAHKLALEAKLCLEKMPDKRCSCYEYLKSKLKCLNISNKEYEMAIKNIAETLQI